MNIKNTISQKIDSLTMYQTITWSLWTIIALAFALSFTDKIYYGPLEMVASLAVILISSFAFHKIFARLFNAPANIQSTYITALILFLIFDPVLTTSGLLALVGVSFFAVVTKYTISVNNLHILNPAAIAAVLAGLFGITYATWWVGTPYLLPAVLITGLIVTYKIRRFDLVAAGTIAALIVSLISISDVTFGIIYTFFGVWPILFFVFFMLTEPLSTPGTSGKRILYGALAGGLSSATYSIGPFYGLALYSTPELALVIANLAAFPFMLKGRVSAPLISKEEIAKDTYEFTFKKPKFLKFKAGQYLEWSLPHKDADKRGISRYFTIASSPTEDTVKLGVKIGEERSSFKDKMLEMEKGDKIYAASLSGDFRLPGRKCDKKLVFIAGGIGVTPFRSMIQNLIDENDSRDLKMFFCNRDVESISYKKTWEDAEEKIGAKVIHVLENKDEMENAESGYLNKEILEKYNVGNKDTIFYISGPTAMVNAYKKMLLDYGVFRGNIMTDYFPGLA